MGRKGRAAWSGRASSGFLRQAQDRLFALERRAQDDSKKKGFRGGDGGKRCKNAIKLAQNGINPGGICYFLITTVSLWSLELTCFDAGPGELQTPRQSKRFIRQSQAIHPRSI
jgi:hypothetical protein